MRDFPSWIPGGVPSLPMPCHFCVISACCFRRKLHGHRESRGVGRLPDACLGGWLAPEICGVAGRIGEGIIGVAEFPWRSWHQRVGKNVSIDENRWERPAFYLVFMANLRGKWWLTSLDKCEHGNWTGFLTSWTFNVAFNILVNVLMGHMPTKPNFRMLPATSWRRHNWQPSGSVLQTLAVCCQLGILWLVYGILCIIMLVYAGILWYVYYGNWWYITVSYMVYSISHAVDLQPKWYPRSLFPPTSGDIKMSEVRDLFFFWDLLHDMFLQFFAEMGCFTPNKSHGTLPHFSKDSQTFPRNS